MNSNLFIKLSIAFGAIAITSTSLFERSTEAQTAYKTDGINFYCGEFTDKSGETIPATMAYIPQAKASVSIIGWKTHIPEWDAQRRCETASLKFQAFYEDGRLNYLTTGVNNKENIICAAIEVGQPCKPEDQLFQIKATNKPQAVLKGLTGIIEAEVFDGPIYQNSGGRTYVSMEELLNAASAVEETDLTSN